MDFPKISIITVVYNSADLLQRTIDSVSALKYTNIEYIIVDGNSTDGTKSLIEKNYLSISSWISEPDGGIYDAMNKAIEMATGDYLWFINAGDTIYDPYILQNIFGGREQYSDFYYGDTIIMSETGKILGLRRKKPSRKLRWTSFKRGMTVCHQSIVVRRSVVPKYDLQYRYSSDFDWVIKILKSGVSVQNTHCIMSIFAEGGATTKNHTKSLKERWNIMCKYYGLAMTTISHAMFCLNILLPKYRKFAKHKAIPLKKTTQK